jgi:hypothetical protein
MAFGPLLAFQRCADYKGDKGLPMGRILVTTLIVSACLLPSLTQAQTSSPSRGTVAPAPPTGGVPRGGSFGVTTRQNPPPPPSPPPHAGPVVPPAPPSALDRADIFGATPRTYAPRFDRVSRRDRFFGYSGGYITDPFGYISQPDSSSPALDRYMRNEQGTGYLPEPLPTSVAVGARSMSARIGSTSGQTVTSLRALNCGFVATTRSLIAAH